MKRIYLFGIGLLLLGRLAIADSTFVAGGVSGEWTREGSPYVVQGDLTVEGGDTLSIGPGVRVYFAGAFQLTADSTAVFYAVGTESDSIVFTGEATPDSTRWAGIYLEYCADTVRFEYCVVENGTGRGSEGLAAGAAISSHSSDFAVEHSTFRRNSGLIEGDTHGGALLIAEYSNRGIMVTIRDCVFEENSANHGGAIALHSISGIMVRCIFRNNRATSGGAIYSFSEGMRIDSCEFVENRAEGFSYARGGAIWYERNRGEVVNCEFRDNHSESVGGAIADYRGNTSATTLYEGNHFFRNSADSIGGALAIGGRALLKKCLIEGNTAPEGGGLYQVNSEQVTITQCTFVGNDGSIAGAAIQSGGQTLNMFNSVVAYNTGGSTIYRPNCATDRFRNNAFWGNDTPLYDYDPCSYRHVIVGTNQNGDSCDADYNLYLDPQFVDAANGDFHLLEDSPLIDAGIAANFFNTTNDPDSTPPDIGAFYFDQTVNASDEPIEIVNSIALMQNYPNPFNAETTIEFSVPTSTRAKLELFDITGRHVRTLYDGVANGRAAVRVSMNGLASGIYVYRLTTPGAQFSNKLLLIR